MAFWGPSANDIMAPSDGATLRYYIKWQKGIIIMS
jgi:hypothetical protein